MAIVRKHCVPPIEEETWKKFKILCIQRNKSIDGMVSELIFQEVANSAFESEEEKR